MLSLIFIITTVCCNPILSISKYESPPTRWITNGILIVGVTDGKCTTETNFKYHNKWSKAYPKTEDVYKAYHILKSLNEEFYTTIHAPYYTLGRNDEFIEASLEFYYGNCKILVKNQSNIKEHEYYNSYSQLSNCAHKYFYNNAKSLDSTDKKINNNEMSSIASNIIYSALIGASIVTMFSYWFIYSYNNNNNNNSK